MLVSRDEQSCLIVSYREVSYSLLLHYSALADVKMLELPRSKTALNLPLQICRDEFEGGISLASRAIPLTE